MNEENFQNRLKFFLDKVDKAYHSRLLGSWFEIWIPGVCKHEVIRCTHGDEIIARRYRRIACLKCGRSLKGPLPDVCFFTERLHPGNMEKD